ncbi:MAG TPA: radical SAM protein [Desulfatiglandales bacterium]|nr:radical SAM protein [Desulfatiglandales bacterium]
MDWIQIEVTSLCGSSCFYCPHTIYRDHWHHASMGLETFRSISNDFKIANLIFLQGWGEPFLNGKIFEMIEIAKNEGSKVGLTTNGMFLNQETIDNLINLKLDILGISLAGTKSENHNRLRSGTDFNQITKCLLDLKEKKAQKNSAIPNVHLAYLMLRSNFEDLRDIIKYAKEINSKDIVCSNLNFFPSPELRNESIFLDEEKTSYYSEVLKGLQSEAKNNAVNFFFYSPVLPESPLSLCPENILKSCFISHDGLVSSCVFTNIPLLVNAGRPLPKRIIYGDINQQSLPEIWDLASYKSFRHIFTERQKSITRDIDLVVDIDRFQQSDEGKINECVNGDLDDLPVHCSHCYRMFGV